MRITGIEVEGIKNVYHAAEITSRNVLLTGPMGSGKSAMIDALHLLFGLPSRFGSTNLDRISPTGSWSAAVSLEMAGDIRRLERQCVGGRSTFMVNGAKADRGEYESAVKRALDVEPAHVVLDEFLKLSGQKRAALFASMLEDGGTVSAEALAGGDVVSWLRERTQDDAQDRAYDLFARRVRAIVGNPSFIVEALRQLVNDFTRDERDARTNLDGMIQRASRAGHGLNEAELSQKIKQLDETAGSIKGRIEDAELATERYQAAKRVLDECEAEIARVTAQIAECDKVIAHGEACEKDKPAYVKALASKEKAVAELDQKRQKLAGQVDALKAASEQLARAKRLMSDLVDQAWRVDEKVFDLFVECLRDVGGEKGEVAAAVKVIRANAKKASMERIVQLAKDILQLALGGSAEVLAAKAEEVEAQIKERERLLTDAAQSHEHEGMVLAEIRRDMEENEKAIAAGTAAKERKTALEATLKTKSDNRVELEQKVRQSAGLVDVASLKHQEAQVATERQRIQAQLKQVRDAATQSGQIEAQRLTVSRLEAVRAAANDLLKAAQEQRDKGTTERLSAVIGPFQERFQQLFGPDPVMLKHHSGGAGRSTEFVFSLIRRHVEVPIEMLSDGETVLAAAAFLSCLQQIKTGPGTLLTLTELTQAVEARDACIRHLPSIGLDAVWIASNTLDPNDPALAQWQVIDMGRRVAEAA